MSRRFEMNQAAQGAAAKEGRVPRRIRAGADENSDALLLFAPEKPAPARPALRMSPPPPPLTVVAGRDSYAKHSRRLPSAGLFAAAVMSLVAGLVVGIAGGYTSAQLPWWPTMPPSQTAVVPAQSASASTPPASAETTIDTPSFHQRLPAPPEPDSAVHTPESPRELQAPARAPGALAVAAGTRAAVSDAAGTGLLDVSSHPAGAIVALDGRVVGVTPVLIRNVNQGTHVIGIEAPGFSRWATSVEVRAGESARVGATLSE